MKKLKSAPIRKVNHRERPKLLDRVRTRNHKAVRVLTTSADRAATTIKPVAFKTQRVTRRRGAGTQVYLNESLRLVSSRDVWYASGFVHATVPPKASSIKRNN